ncbi:odorant receptor 10-like [Aphomia sociella]
MAFIQNFKKFFKKEGYDFNSPNINLYNFHPQLPTYLAVMGIFSNNRNSKLRSSQALEAIFVVHGILVMDYSFTTECFFYFLILGIVITVYGSVLYNKDSIIQLLNDMNEDFLYICNMESKYRDQFLEGQLIIHQSCCVWFSFMTLIAVLYILLMVNTLLVQSLLNMPGVYIKRPLLFPMWLPYDDPYRTPNYEIFLSLQLCLLFIVCQVFTGYIYTLFHILLHYYYIMQLIMIDFEVLFDGLDETVTCLQPNDPRREQVQLTLNNRIRRVVQWHLSVFKAVKTVSSVFGSPMVYQTVFTSIGLCMMLYQIADSLEKGTINIMFVVLFLGTSVQLWIPCYIGTLLRDKGYAVGDACWNSGWHETSLGKLIRADIILVIQRSQRPVVIKFIGLPELQLETFSSIVSTAYSYFNMLRQYNSDT